MIELHCHSTLSDGELSPKELVDFAKQKKIDLLAITDHSVVNVNPDIYNYALSNGVKLICGVEMTANDLSDFHILGYGIKNGDIINYAYNLLRQYNIDVCEKMLYEFKKRGYDLNIEAVRRDGETLTKHLLKRAFVYGGYATDVYDAKKYFRGLDISPTLLNFPAKLIIELIHCCGGIAVVAHIDRVKFKSDKQKLDYSQLKTLINYLVKNGIDGIEVFNYHTGVDNSEFLNTMADKYGLLTTIGSDYHYYLNNFGVVFGQNKIDKFLEGIYYANQGYNENNTIEMLKKIEYFFKNQSAFESAKDLF